MDQVEREPNKAQNFLKADKFYNVVHKERAISILDKPGVVSGLKKGLGKPGVRFVADLVPELHQKRLEIENRDYEERMRFLKELKGKLSDKEREIAIAGTEYGIKSKLMAESMAKNDQARVTFKSKEKGLKDVRDYDHKPLWTSDEGSMSST